jgi:hypothetical protein
MDNFNNDDAFMSLLSSQRKLLMQIRTETNTRQPQQQQQPATSALRQQQATMQNPSQVSPSIGPTRPPITFLHDGSNQILNRDPPASRMGSFTSLSYNNHDLYSSLNHFDDNDEVHDDEPSLLHDDSLGDFLIEPQPIHRIRRPSDQSSSDPYFHDLNPNRIEKLSSINDQIMAHAFDELTRIRSGSPFNANDQSTDSSLHDLLPHDDESKSTKKRRKRGSHEKTDPNQDLKLAPREDFASKHVRDSASPHHDTSDDEVQHPSSAIKDVDGKVKRFADALDKSSKSQLEINKWDRKMGLKRSHSKTMTMSMQSRKKLRSLLQNIPGTFRS